MVLITGYNVINDPHRVLQGEFNEARAAVKDFFFTFYFAMLLHLDSDI